MTIEQPHHITHETGNPETWVCRCGNAPHLDGFFPCTPTGGRVDYARGWDDSHYLCAKCGAIIKRETLEIVGQKVESVVEVVARVESPEPS